MASRIFGGSGGGTGGGGVAAPTASWSEEGTVGDDLRLAVALADDAQIDDRLSLAAALGDDAQVDDAFQAIIQTNWAEDAQANDLLRLTVSGLDVPRTATPDTDLFGDGWTDQASTATPHGNESLLVKGKSTLANDERRAHLLVDLRPFVGCTAGAAGLVLSFTASASAASTLLWAAASSAARPFTESTLTWANQPATGTLATGSIAVAVASAGYSLTIPQAALTTALAAGFLLITFTQATNVVPPTVTVLSRDNATAANRPKITVNAVRGS